MFKKKAQIKNLSPLRSSDRRKFTTHAGANATLVSGTVFVGAHPGQEDRILWIQYGKDPTPLPTVYSLWHNPGLVPLLHTPDVVVDKLQTGADLMIPGLVGGPPWPRRAEQGAVVAVAGLARPTVPAVVGVCKIDISSLGSVRGLKGAAVEGVTWYGDELWRWSQSGTGGREAPARIDGWDVLVSGLEEQGDGGVAIEASRAHAKGRLPRNGHTLEAAQEDQVDSTAVGEPWTGQVGSTAVGEPWTGQVGSTAVGEPTTGQVDQAFFEAFLYSAWDARKHGSPPAYGIDFPVQPSYLISNMIQPRLRTQSPSYSIKKTSWKTVKKFIKHLDKEVLVKSRDRQGGETVILDIDFDDARVQSFVPYKLPKPDAAATGQDAANAAVSANDTAISQRLSLITLYRPSSKLVPDLLSGKSSFYTASQITNALKTYIAANPSLSQGASSKRNIKLDPFIANNILSSSSASDKSALASSEIGRDVLQKRIVLEKRGGSKTVTKISNLEAFFINPNVLGPELQKKCAGSASVGQLIGGKPGMLEILVQGDQRDVLQKELSRRGVRKESIELTDKTKKGKGKK
ncbi:hypothetical protein DV737_g3675, partial [Chaetothyriales sp. CBS 132003]